MFSQLNNEIKKRDAKLAKINHALDSYIKNNHKSNFLAGSSVGSMTMIEKMDSITFNLANLQKTNKDLENQVSYLKRQQAQQEKLIAKMQYDFGSQELVDNLKTKNKELEDKLKNAENQIKKLKTPSLSPR